MNTDKILKLPYEQFIGKLRDEVAEKKVRALILAGREDGNPDDEVVEFKSSIISARALMPLQKQLLIESSIKHTLSGKSISTLKTILDGEPALINYEPILTLDGKYVIDGHHRWVEAYLMNPNSRVVVTDIQLNMNPIDVMKIIQLSVAANSGDIPFSKGTGTNLYEISEKDFKKFVNWTVTDEVLSVFDKDKESLSNYLWNNVLTLKKYNKPIIGAPDRIYMPQPGKANGTLDSLRKGEVDFKKPYAKMEKRIPTLDEFINESRINKSAEGVYLQFYPVSCAFAICQKHEYGLNHRRHEWLDTNEFKKAFDVLYENKISFAYQEHKKELAQFTSEITKKDFELYNGSENGFKFDCITRQVNSIKDVVKAVDDIVKVYESIKSKMSVLDEYLNKWTKFWVIEDYFAGLSLVTDPMYKIFTQLKPESYITGNSTEAKAVYDEIIKNGKLILTDDISNTNLKGDLPDHNIQYYELNGAYYFVSFPRHKNYVIVKFKNKPSTDSLISTEFK